MAGCLEWRGVFQDWTVAGVTRPAIPFALGTPQARGNKKAPSLLMGLFKIWLRDQDSNLGPND